MTKKVTWCIITTKSMSYRDTAYIVTYTLTHTHSLHLIITKPLYIYLIIKRVLEANKVYKLKHDLSGAAIILTLSNRGIKTQRTIKTKLPLKFCMNGLVIVIGQLGLAQLTNRKRGRKDVNKRISRAFVNRISMIVC